MISRLVGLCHVGQSNRAVIKYVISRLKHKRRTWLGLARAQRRAIMREIIRTHAENRDLYRVVITGRL